MKYGVDGMVTIGICLFIVWRFTKRMPHAFIPHGFSGIHTHQCVQVYGIKKSPPAWAEGPMLKNFRVF